MFAGVRSIAGFGEGEAWERESVAVLGAALRFASGGTEVEKSEGSLHCLLSGVAYG